jgi:hypothetical protein
VRWLLAVVVAVGLTACVGPAPTTSQYEGKAAHTAADALSQLETARLAIENSARMPTPYLTTVLSESEDAFGSIQTTFDSIQPPDDPAADQLRSDLDDLLSAGSDGLAQMRILARRDDTAGMRSTARQLAATAAGLERFNQEHDS